MNKKFILRPICLLLALLMLWAMVPAAVQAAESGPVITAQPQPDDALIGEVAQVSVEAVGEGLRYQWYYRDLPDGSLTKSSIKTATYSLTVKPVNVNRELYCVITDASGRQVRTQTVKLLRPLDVELAITRQPQSAIAAMGEVAAVSVEAAGEGLSYQWYFRNTPGGSLSKSSITSSTYCVTVSKSNYDRLVYCVITDGRGNKVTTETVALRMDPPAENLPVYYPTLPDALARTNGSFDAQGAAAVVVKESGNTVVTLLKDEALTETLVIDSDLTLELGGFTLTSTAYPAIRVAADAVIRGQGGSLLVTGGDQICALSVEEGSCVIDGGSYHTTSENAANTVIHAASGTALTVDNASVKALDTANGVVVGVHTESGSTFSATGSSFLVTTEKSLGNRAVYACGSAVLRNCSAIGEADYLGANGAYTSRSEGICSESDLELYNCTVWGSHSGVMVLGSVLVDGGTYSGYGHGAFYLGGEGTTGHFYNATFKWATMRKGTVTNSVAGTNHAAFYIGAASHITAYIDGCKFQSNHTNRKSACIALRTSGTERDNSVYVSNTAFSHYNKCAFRNNGATAGRNILAYSGVGNTYTKPNSVFLDAANGRYTEDSYARP